LGEGEEGADDKGIELRAAGFVEAADSFLVRQTFTIWARRNHGVKRIDYTDNAGDDGNFCALQAGRIALTIERFVVVENIERCAFETGKHPQDSPAILRMLFHEGVFVCVQASGLTKNRVRDSHLPDVVEKRGYFKILKFGFLEAKFLPNTHSPFRQASAVDAGVEILEIQELIEGTDDGIAQCSRLFFQLLDPERLQRPENRGSFRGRWSLVIRHCSYLQNNKQVPEPDEELELFTQADTAW
jgi:hypothetical protein